MGKSYISSMESNYYGHLLHISLNCLAILSIPTTAVAISSSQASSIFFVQVKWQAAIRFISEPQAWTECLYLPSSNLLLYYIMGDQW